MVEQTQSVQVRKRARCPFYSFSLHDLGEQVIMMDSRGNQCALKTLVYAPCHMKINGVSPDWEECCYNNESKRKEIVRMMSRNMRVFPSGKGGKYGYSMQDWVRHILDNVALPINPFQQ